jgi:hypothetical protein
MDLCIIFSLCLCTPTHNSSILEPVYHRLFIQEAIIIQVQQALSQNHLSPAVDQLGLQPISPI